MGALQAVLDHVAVAVPDTAAALPRWRDELGGAAYGAGSTDLFATYQLVYAGGGRLELLSPAPGAGPSFLTRFLERFGARIHHVTLLVDDLHAALDTLDRGGLEAVDVRLDEPAWQEAFLRPGQVGGIVVQVAASSHYPHEWPGRDRAASMPTAGPVLRGPLLRHPDLPAAERVWRLLGAGVTRTPDGLHCAWPGSALTVAVEEGASPGPVRLRFEGAPALPADPALGPAVG